jgi:hypothetical protein
MFFLRYLRIHIYVCKEQHRLLYLFTIYAYISSVDLRERKKINLFYDIKNQLEIRYEILLSFTSKILFLRFHHLYMKNVRCEKIFRKKQRKEANKSKLLRFEFIRFWNAFLHLFFFVRLCIVEYDADDCCYCLRLHEEFH